MHLNSLALPLFMIPTHTAFDPVSFVSRPNLWNGGRYLNPDQVDFAGKYVDGRRHSTRVKARDLV